MAGQAPTKQKAFDFWKSIEEIDRFLAGTSEVHQTLRRLVVNLERAKIPYAVMGGMAVNAHGHRQTTDDVDILLAGEAFERFEEILVRNLYGHDARRWRRFIDRSNGIPVDVSIAGTPPGWLRTSPVVYPDPVSVTERIDGCCYVDLRTLVELKLAMWRFRDLADVSALIGVHKLNESFADRLDPSVRSDYLDCLEERHREDEHEARED
jgi:hypothetical protein